jgi:hypothetical protein
MNEQVENPAIICSECIELRKEIEETKAIILELQQRLNRNSFNSSISPSANPPNAPKLPPQEPTGQKQGSQQGHRGHFRRQLPPARVNEVFEYPLEK